MTDDFEEQVNAARAAIGKRPVWEYRLLPEYRLIGYAFRQAAKHDREAAMETLFRDNWLHFATAQVSS